MAILPYLRDQERIKFLVEQNVPQSLRNEPVWLAYYYEEKASGKITKRPCQGYKIGDPNCCKTFNEVIRDGFPGIMITEWNNIVAFDIDDKKAKEQNSPINIEETYQRYSKDFFDFLADHDPYTEVSPSGCGLRYLFRCSDKDQHQGTGRVNIIPEHCVGGELFIKSGFVTITGYQSNTAQDRLELIKSEEPRELPEVSVNDLVPFWNSKHNVVDFKTKDPINESFEKYPTIQEVFSALDCCKLDQSPLVKKSYRTVMNQEYEHYDYWMKIMMACHDYGVKTNQTTQMLQKVTEWSRLDPSSYESDDDVMTHWMSFNPEDGSRAAEASEISYRTLFAFAKRLQFDWPFPKYDSKGKNTGGPEQNRLDNFSYLMDFFDIRFFNEPFTQGIFVDGDPDKVDQYFLNTVTTANRFFGKVGPISKDDLYGCCLRLAQNNGYGNVASLRTPFDGHIARIEDNENLALQWLSKDYDDLPEELLEPDTDPAISNIDYLLSCLEFGPGQDPELAKSIIDIFFFGVTMPLYNTQRIWPEHNFMLVFTGPENCRKTSFFSSLAPRSIRNYLIKHSTETLDSEKSLRDFKIMMSASMILVVDEFDIFYKSKNDSMFKNLVTCSDVTYIPIYEKAIRTFDRQAALCGTTNKSKINFEAHSNRRIAMVKVKWIDTDKLDKIRWHTFYGSYIKRGKELMMNGLFPWKMTNALIKDLYQSNEQYRGQNDLELLIRELFDFDHEYPGHDTITNVQIPKEENGIWAPAPLRSLIEQNAHPRIYKLSDYNNTLKKLCGIYTDTVGKRVDMPKAKGFIEDGIAHQGFNSKGIAKYKRFIMPPRITEFVPEEPELK